MVAGGIGRAIGRLSGQWYISGSGNGQPMGLFNAGGSGSAGTIATGGSLLLGPAGGIAEKLVDVAFSVDSQYRMRGEWLMHDSTIHTIRKVRDQGGGTIGNWLFNMSDTAGLQGGAPDRILGYPVWADSNVASLASDASVAAFGDLPAYSIRDVRGVQISRSDAFDLNQQRIRGILRTDGDLIDQTAVNILRARVS